MHRPTLILRRFGPLTFGLGYYDGGTWFDHEPTDGATAGDEAMDVVHGWLSCCESATDEEPSVAFMAQLPRAATSAERRAAAR